MICPGRVDRARACTCIRFPAAKELKDADQVYLGRAGRVVCRPRGGDPCASSVQRIKVLQVLKGRVPRTVVVRDPGKSTNLCLRTYKAGEVALIFVRRGVFHLCAGNYDLSVQMSRMNAYLSLTRGVVSPRRPLSLAAALEHYWLGMPPLGRPLRVRYPPLAGRRFRRGKLRGRFVGRGKRADVVLTRVIARGAMLLVRGATLRYKHLFRLLVVQEGKKRTVVHEDKWNGCGGTDACRLHGRCRFVAGRCEARTRQDCLKSHDCRRRGRCTPWRGRCALRSTADCQRASGCREYGDCTLVRGACRPTRDAHCRRSTHCREMGHCSLRGGACVPGSAQDCRQATTACRSNGRCSFKGGFCEAVTDADCRRAAACKRDGRCRARGGWCVR